MDIMTLPLDELRRMAPRMTWYHTMDLGNGLVVEGDFDLLAQLPGYGFPENMSALRVLDVGRASGYFSFEFERRGAEVMSIDLPSPLDKDFVGGDLVRQLFAEDYEGKLLPERAAHGHRADFVTAHRLIGSKVRSAYCRIYDISPDTVDGMYDLSFLGSILNHLANPIAALTAVRSVTRGSVVVCNPFDPDARQNDTSVRFVGRQAKGLTTWWLPTAAAMCEMLHASGFTNPRIVTARMDFKNKSGTPLPHYVVHADVGDATDDWRAIKSGQRRVSGSHAETPAAPVETAAAAPRAGRKLLSMFGAKKR